MIWCDVMLCCYIISYHILSYHISHHNIYQITSHHITSYIISYHIISYIMSCHVIYHTISYYIILYYIILYYTILYCNNTASAVVMLDTPCSEVVWRVLATYSIRQFPLHLPSRASPCAITFELDSTFWDTFAGLQYNLPVQTYWILN